MVAFYNVHTPGRMAPNRNLHPLGNDHRTTFCCETNIIFSIELDERKDKTNKVMHDVPEFDKETVSKISALFCA